MKNQLIWIFLLSIFGETSAMDSILKNPLPKRTSALDHFQICETYVKEKKSDSQILSEFMKSIQNKGDDPCMDKQLKAIARELGATETDLQQMWCEYGLTDEGHEFFLKQPRRSEDDKARLVTAIRSALSE